MSSNLGINKIEIHTSTYSLSLNWDVEFHVHTHASLLAIGVMLTQNLIGKHV
jgi:hypothetical protein